MRKTLTLYFHWKLCFRNFVRLMYEDNSNENNCLDIKCLVCFTAQITFIAFQYIPCSDSQMSCCGKMFLVCHTTKLALHTAACQYSTVSSNLLYPKVILLNECRWSDTVNPRGVHALLPRATTNNDTHLPKYHIHFSYLLVISLDYYHIWAINIYEFCERGQSYVSNVDCA
jgi:hypothetical protein